MSALLIGNAGVEILADDFLAQLDAFAANVARSGQPPCGAPAPAGLAAEAAALELGDAGVEIVTSACCHLIVEIGELPGVARTVMISSIMPYFSAFLGAHEIVALHVLLDASRWAGRSFRTSGLVHLLLGFDQPFGADGHIGSLAAGPAQGLMDHDFAVGQGQALALLRRPRAKTRPCWPPCRCTRCAHRI